MDRLEWLGNQISQLTPHDIKSMYTQAKNVVLNVSEAEAKVREATNDDPWGASSTLMQDIAQGTFNFQQFNEIMPCIYSRFMDKEARQWRQIYKALQLLEYLIKHGSERVVDDARAHLGTLKMLRSFHYIDEKGKDEGINVRNRAKELVELLADVDKIRIERRKAKANKNKYIGIGNDGGFGGFSRYGGFGNDSYEGGSSFGNDHYGSGSSSRVGGGFGGFSDSSSRQQYEEYDAGGDELPSRSSGSRPSTSNAGGMSSARSTHRRQDSTPAPAAPAPAANLLDFDDDVGTNATTVTAAAASPAPILAQSGLATNKALPKPIGLDDDDFDDFQTAPVQAQAPSLVPSPSGGQQQQQQGGAGKPNLMQLLNAAPLSPTQPTSAANASGAGGLGGLGMGGMRMHRGSGSGSVSGVSGGAPMQQGLFSGGGIGGGVGGGATSTGTRPTATSAGIMGGSPMVPTPMRANTASPGTQQKKTDSVSKSGGGFDDLWNMSLASSGQGTPGNGTSRQGMSMKDLQKEKATAGLWGSNGGGGSRPAGNAGFGSFGNVGSGGNGGDDLLL